MLLGSAFANIGACASVTRFHAVGAAGEPARIVGDDEGDARPYVLNVVVKFRLVFVAILPEIQVLVALFP